MMNPSIYMGPVVLTSLLLVFSLGLFFWALWPAHGGRLSLTSRDEPLLAHAVADESRHRRLIEELQKKARCFGCICMLLCGVLAVSSMLGLFGLRSHVLQALSVGCPATIICVAVPLKRISRQLLILEDLRGKLNRW